MGLRGPKKKPTALELLQGKPGHRKINKSEPAPPVDSELPAPPDWLDKIGKEVWRRVGIVLHPIKLVTQADREAFARYCDISSQWHKAREFINKNGQSYTIKDRDGNENHKPYPEAKTYNALIGPIQRYEAYFGLTPSARTGISIPQEPEKKDGFQSYMKLVKDTA